MQRNGIDVDLWGEVNREVGADPAEAKVVVKTRHRWDGGFAIEGLTSAVESAGEVLTRKLVYRTDWPEDVGGRNSAPTPGEAILSALGGCVGLSFVAGAMGRGIDIKRLEIAIEAHANLEKVFGAGERRPGLTDVKIALHVEADADPEVLAEVGKQATSTSTVFDTLTHATPIAVEVVSAS